MEANGDFIKASESLNILKEQLAYVTSQEFAQDEKKKVTSQIEDHIEECCNYLAAREIQLLNELIINLSLKEKQIQAQIEIQIELCSKTIESARLLHEANPAFTSSILQPAINVNIPQYEDPVHISFPDPISKTISGYGMDTNHYSHLYLIVPSMEEIVQDLVSFKLSGGSVERTNLRGYVHSIKTKDGSIASLNTTMSHEVLPQLAQNTSDAASHQASIGPVTTLAGSDKGYADGTTAEFSDTLHICFNPNDDCVYVSDTNNKALRRVTKQGEVSTYKKLGGLLTRGLAFYHKENSLFVCASNQINKILLSGEVSVFAGSNKDGSVDGVGVAATFSRPYGMAINQQTGDVFVSDVLNQSIRRITPSGNVSTIAGGRKGNCDGIGKNAQFNRPTGIYLDENSNALVVCDTANDKIRLLDIKTGAVTTFCSMPHPYGITAMANGSFIVASGSKLVSVSKIGDEVKTIAGSEADGYKDGDPLASQFNSIGGVCIDTKTKTCFVADDNNCKIRKFPIM